MKQNRMFPDSLARRVLALLCVLALCVGFIPAGVLASAEGETGDPASESETGETAAYIIALNANYTAVGETTPEPMTVKGTLNEDGETVTFSSNGVTFTREGYILRGFAAEAEDPTTIYTAPGGTYSIPSSLFTPITDSSDSGADDGTETTDDTDTGAGASAVTSYTCTLYAVWAATQTLTLTFESGDNGSASVKADGGKVELTDNESATIGAGQEVTVTASPNTHYHVASIEVKSNNSDVKNVTCEYSDNSVFGSANVAKNKTQNVTASFTMPESEVTVTVTFAANEYTVEVKEENGTDVKGSSDNNATLSLATVTDDGSSGATATLNVTLAGGYNAAISVDPTASVTVKDNKNSDVTLTDSTIPATTSGGTYTVTISGIAADTTVTVTYGLETYTAILYDPLNENVSKKVEFTAENATMPDSPQCEGYSFLGWYTAGENGGLSANKTETLSVAAADSDKTITLYANWAITAVNVTATADGDTYTSEAWTSKDVTVNFAAKKSSDSTGETTFTYQTETTTVENEKTTTGTRTGNSVTITASDGVTATTTVTVTNVEQPVIVNGVTYTLSGKTDMDSFGFGSITVRQDRTAPAITSIKAKWSDSLIDKILNFLKYGNFFNSDVVVTVTATDTDGSGVAKIALSDDEGNTYSGIMDADGSAYVFTLPENVLTDGTGKELTVTATDTAGNYSTWSGDGDGVDILSSNYFLYETAAPALTDATKYYTDGSGNSWLLDGEAVTFTVSDEVNGSDHSGLYSVTVKMGDEVLSATSDEAEQDESGTFTYTTEKSEAKVGSDTYTIAYSLLNEGENIISVTMVDNAGNEETETIAVYKDTKTPTVTSVTVKDAARCLPYGTYDNESVTVTVEVSDAGYSSGIGEVTLEYGGEEYSATTIADNAADTNGGPVTATAVFTIPYSKDVEDALTVRARDNVYAEGTTNSHDVTYTTSENGNVEKGLDTGRLMLEQTSPTGSLSIADTSGAYTESGRTWYETRELSLTVSAADAAGRYNSGLYSVKVELNDETSSAVILGGYSAAWTETDSKTVTLTDYWAESSFNEGKNTLELTVTDNAGNEYTASLTFCLDLRDPVVTGFDFAATGGPYNIDGDGDIVTATDYGYYFSQDTDVTVNVSDAAPSSGIQTIYFCTVDVDGTTRLRSSSIGGSADTESSTAARAVFRVSAGFKGQIYACVADNVKNAQSSANGISVSGVTGSFLHPEGLIVETEAMHSAYSGITITLPATAATDAEGNDLYSGNTVVGISVSDTYSGIRSVEIAVESPNDTGSNTSYTLNVGAGGGLSDSGWTKNATDRNLVTSLSRSITVTNNSNDIKLTVTITDNAGNTSSEEATLSIDKDAPAITVSYDNNDVRNDRYFNADRTMTVTVTERNFNGADISCTRTGTAISFGGSLSEWIRSGPDGNGNYTYTLTRTFSEDGDYLYSMSVTDLAGNQTADPGVSYQGAAAQDYVIDQTVPEISLSLDGVFSNGCYLNKDSSVTVAVTEHNFDAGGYSAVARLVSVNDRTEPILVRGSWNTSGDANTITFAITEEGVYYIESVTVTDLAGNEATVTGEDFGLGMFVMDKSLPTIEILDSVGGDDIGGTANRDAVTPVIVVRDTNFNTEGVQYTLTGCRTGSSAADYTAASTADTAEGDGWYISFSDFAYEEEADDIYTISVTVTDLAGNEYSGSATFSVNRYGSTYMISAATQSGIENYWIGKEVEVVIVEINPDKLIEHTVTVTRGSSTTTLAEGEDYQVTEEAPYDNAGDRQTESRWYEYTYTISADNFTEEGEYTVGIYSADAAANEQTNAVTGHMVNLFSGSRNDLVVSDENDPATAQVNFVVDKTAPQNIINDLDRTKYYANAQTASIYSIDETRLDYVEIYVDGELAETVQAEELDPDNTWSYTLSSAGEYQELTVISYDKAGNVSEEVGARVLITTNLFIQFINSPLAMILAALVIIAAIVLIFLLVKRRKRNEEEQATKVG